MWRHTSELDFDQTYIYLHPTELRSEFSYMSIITQKPKIAKLPEPKVMHPKKTEKVKPHKQKDINSIYNQNSERYSEEVKESTASYLQSMKSFQQEVIESWKSNTDLLIMIQQEFAKNSQMNGKGSDNAIKLVNTAEQTNKAQKLQNQILLHSSELVSKGEKMVADIKSKKNTNSITNKKSNNLNEDSKHVIEAARVVIDSMQSKMNITEKELKTVKQLLEKEKDEHQKTKKKLRISLDYRHEMLLSS